MSAIMKSISQRIGHVLAKPDNIYDNAFKLRRIMNIVDDALEDEKAKYDALKKQHEEFRRFAGEQSEDLKRQTDENNENWLRDHPLIVIY
jgi:hypothetical protein